jgi:CheY-like chemotaxis protein
MRDNQVSASFIWELRTALRNLYDPAKLRKSPLIELFEVDQRDDPSTALRRILVDAVEALKPDASVPPQTETWRTYQVLFHRHVEQFTQSAVADDLGLSIRHLRRQEALALEVLADYLRTHYNLGLKWQNQEAPPARIEGKVDSQTPSREQELDWLQVTRTSKAIGVEEMIQEALETVNPLIQASQVQVDSRVPKDLPRLVVQANTVRQALLSILTAAIRCVPRGRVDIRAEVLDRYVQLTINPVKHRSVPPPPSDAGAERLKMAQRLVKLSGGSLDVVPCEDGERAFVAKLVLPATEQVPVLVIDDNPDTLQLLQRYLSGSRYRFLGTHDPEQALALAEESVPRIIVLDVMLPAVDGWQLMGHLREHPKTRGIPIIVCTILPQEQLALALGAAAFIRKPVNPKALLSALDHQLDLSLTESH